MLHCKIQHVQSQQQCLWFHLPFSSQFSHQLYIDKQILCFFRGGTILILFSVGGALPSQAPPQLRAWFWFVFFHLLLFQPINFILFSVHLRYTYIQIFSSISCSAFHVIFTSHLAAAFLLLILFLFCLKCHVSPINYN